MRVDQSISKTAGVILGCTVGDAIGLPAEGLSRQRLLRRKWSGKPWRHRLIGTFGMWSDDTEHTFMVGNAILESKGDPKTFGRLFCRKLKRWFLALPAGVGFATARACLKLWLGFPPEKAGVFSAGNGPAMRSGIIGAAFPHDQKLRNEFVRISTQATHSDPKALVAASAVAEIVALIVREGSQNRASRIAWLEASAENCDDGEWAKLLRKAAEFARENRRVDEFANAIGCEDSVSGYCFHSVPVAIYCWVVFGKQFRKGIEAAIECGGDTDTVAAIAGAMLGGEAGIDGIPGEWEKKVVEWPRKKSHLNKLAQRISAGDQRKITYPFYLIPFRNLFFLVVVLAHGFIRIFR